MKLICALLLLSLGSTLAYKSYAGYQVLQTVPLTHADFEPLASVLKDARFYFWSWPQVGSTTEVMASPDHVGDLMSILKDLGLQPSVLHADVGKLVEQERAEIEALRSIDSRSSRITWDRYMDLDEIYSYLDEMVAAFPNLANIEEIGQTYEGRPIKVLRISNGPGKKAVFIDSAIHSAEWSGPPVSLFAIYQMLENYEDNRDLVDLADWYILPVANPDGYVYTWTEDRLWRKTRRPNEGSDCVGTDPNRNFDTHWGEGDVTDPCVWNYQGSNVYSELESKAMADFLAPRGQAGDIVLYVALHTFGQVLLYPYGFTTDLPPNGVELQNAGDECIDALTAVRGTNYTVGSLANTMYYAYGNTIDFAYTVAKIPYSYTYELPKGGAGGHDPPPSNILPVVTETWESIKTLARRAVTSSPEVL